MRLLIVLLLSCGASALQLQARPHGLTAGVAMFRPAAAIARTGSILAAEDPEAETPEAKASADTEETPGEDGGDSENEMEPDEGWNIDNLMEMMGEAEDA